MITSIIANMGINNCRIVNTSISITVVVSITTIIIIAIDIIIIEDKIAFTTIASSVLNIRLSTNLIVMPLLPPSY